jgi:hypothetical protein
MQIGELWRQYENKVCSNEHPFLLLALARLYEKRVCVTKMINKHNSQKQAGTPTDWPPEPWFVPVTFGTPTDWPPEPW